MNSSLRTTIRLNALSCLGFGMAFALAPDPIGAFLDGAPPLVLRLVGIGLAIHGLHLAIASRRKSIGRFELGYFILGDSLWVLGSLVLVALVPGVIHSPSAILSTLAVAALVGSFAFLQARWGRDLLCLSCPQNSL